MTQSKTTTPKSMRKDQIEYVRNRADSIFETKKRAIKRGFEKSGRTLNNEEKITALSKGKFTVDTSPPSSWRNEWYNRVEFTEEKEPTFDQEGYKEAVKPIHEAYTKLIDELMIGDNTQALELLRAFETS